MLHRGNVNFWRVKFDGDEPEHLENMRLVNLTISPKTNMGYINVTWPVKYLENELGLLNSNLLLTLRTGQGVKFCDEQVFAACVVGFVETIKLCDVEETAYQVSSAEVRLGQSKVIRFKAEILMSVRYQRFGVDDTLRARIETECGC